MSAALWFCAGAVSGAVGLLVWLWAEMTRDEAAEHVERMRVDD